MGILSHLVLSPVTCVLLWSCICMLVPFLSNHNTQKLPEDEIEDEFILTLVVFDVFLVLVFILQHAIMATRWFKSILAFFNIIIVERLVYVSATSVALMNMMLQWERIYSFPLWYIDTSEGITLWLFFTLIHVLAWFVLFMEVLAMDPLEMIGIKQIFYYHQGLQSPVMYLPHRLKRLYTHMRHAGVASLFVILWCHPHMTLDRFILAFLLNIFINFGFSVTHFDYMFIKTEFVKKVSYHIDKVQ